MNLDPLTFNHGTVLARKPAAEPRQKTIVISGPSRSGTTMVAEVLLKLGLNLGTELDINLYEDIPIRRAIREQRWDDLADLVEQYDRRFDQWGWKYPESLEHLEHFADRLRNPFFIFLFRDPVSTSIRNSLSDENQPDPGPLMIDALNYMMKAVRFMQETPHPCLGLSYEKSVYYSNHMLDTLCDFLFLDPSAHERDAALQAVSFNNLRYKKAGTSRDLLGVLDLYDREKVAGWAARQGQTEPLELELWIDFQKVKTFRADHYREDLEKRKLGSAHHGFNVKIDSYLSKSSPHRIEIRYKDNEYPLRGTPVFVYPE